MSEPPAFAIRKVDFKSKYRNAVLVLKEFMCGGVRIQIIIENPLI